MFLTRFLVQLAAIFSCNINNFFTLFLMIHSVFYLCLYVILKLEIVLAVTEVLTLHLLRGFRVVNSKTFTFLSVALVMFSVELSLHKLFFPHFRLVASSVCYLCVIADIFSLMYPFIYPSIFTGYCAKGFKL